MLTMSYMLQNALLNPRTKAILMRVLRIVRRWCYGVLRWILDPALIIRQIAVISTLQLLYRLHTSISKHVKRAMYKLFNPKYYEAMNRLECAMTYPDYKYCAQELDTLSPSLQRWKESSGGNLFDLARMKRRIKQFERMPHSEDETYDLMFALRTGLLRKQFGLANPKLYKGYTSSTLQIVERYLDSILKAMRTCARSTLVPTADKLHFLKETRQAFGRTALLLSGGLTLGTYHFGIIKGLAEIGSLPRFVSGSSAGSIAAAWLAVQTQEDLQSWCANPTLGEVVMLRFHGPSDAPVDKKVETMAKKVFEGEGFLSIDTVKETMRKHVGDTTMLEAYEKTGRVVSIVVSSDAGVPFLINYLTAPHVYLWSAVCASASVPGIFGSVELRAKNRHGEDVPYERMGTRWRDGSFTDDLPRKRLSELFNVNHFIVSQVSPHWTFFGELPENVGFLGKFMNFIFDQVRYSFLSIDHVIPSRFHPLALITQEGMGDITIRPTESIRTSLAALFQVLTDPKDTAKYIRESERQVWKISTRLHLVCAVEMLMDVLIEELEQDNLAARILGDGEDSRIRDHGDGGIATAQTFGETNPARRRANTLSVESTQQQMTFVRRNFSSGRLFSLMSPIKSSASFGIGDSFTAGD
eukprot:GEMP01003496.1.p1 GENE.GEMP01003496.1~~GEMP01003496.1.p1  ORF type:complete len:640 (+),score=161.57 GEMP01003496.1:164-2083(+)